ncbi:PEP-CTERM sorting domain-containing protein [Salinimonas marina]|uniref:PEP-CTERM sorting domain-containing protein n=1 Tax=Salinimonas marina TaxID=2785918 RepID=A0A7S9DV56_9ALTE|nr:PEP-CTERM sorting domain-containing protein [Salinimonas marina]QPG04509.1 PEP-CTERM sorting domain-containing protein [Salinimonas marina]
MFTLASFTFLGEALDLVNDVFAFDFERDFSSPTNGFDFLFFDINTTAFGEAEELAVSFYFDRAFPMDSSLEIFSLGGDIVDQAFADDGIEFSVVPEPSVLSVFALGMMLLLTARRQRR